MSIYPPYATDPIFNQPQMVQIALQISFVSLVGTYTVSTYSRCYSYPAYSRRGLVLLWERKHDETFLFRCWVSSKLMGIGDEAI